MAKEGNERLGKGTFGEVDQKTIGLKNVKDLGEMGKVLGQVRAGHKNVIQVDTKEGESMEKVVH